MTIIADIANPFSTMNERVATQTLTPADRCTNHKPFIVGPRPTKMYELIKATEVRDKQNVVRA